MAEIENVIKGLEHCRKTSCESCPYNVADVKSSNPICLINEMLSDALALLKEQEDMGKELTDAMELVHKKNARIIELTDLLKEQEAVVRCKETIDSFDAHNAPELIRCKDCKHCFIEGENVRFNVCKLNHCKVQSDDWFCADGERR